MTSTQIIVVVLATARNSTYRFCCCCKNRNGNIFCLFDGLVHIHLKGKCLSDCASAHDTWTHVLSLMRSKHIKDSKERYLLGQNTACEFRGNPLHQATKRHLKNSSTVKNNNNKKHEKWDGKLSHLSVIGWAMLVSCIVLGRKFACCILS